MYCSSYSAPRSQAAKVKTAAASSITIHQPGATTAPALINRQHLPLYHPAEGAGFWLTKFAIPDILPLAMHQLLLPTISVSAAFNERLAWSSCPVNG